MVPALLEFCGSAALVFIGCGMTVTNNVTTVAGADPTAWRLTMAVGFAATYSVLFYVLSPFGAGQLSWPVTMGAMMNRITNTVQGSAHMIAQLLGSFVGAFLLWLCLRNSEQDDSILGSNVKNDDYKAIQVFMFEFFLTILVVYTYCTVVRTEKNDNVALGIAYFVGLLTLIPMDGGSLSPTRSFGPALMATIDKKEDLFDDFWIFFIAPMLGGVAGGWLANAAFREQTAKSK